MGIRCQLEFGRESLDITVPDGSELLSLPAARPLGDAARAVRESLARPIGSPSLVEVVRSKSAAGRAVKAVVVVSDQTRPVPYKGADGILVPVLEALRAGGAASIEVIVATGTHRALGDGELRALLPEAAFAPGVRVTNHVCTDAEELRHIGRTSRGTEAVVNRRYLEADIKVLTGLVEPHFMCGASGGPKSVCPGLVGEKVTEVFHGAALLADPRSASLVLEGNPCREESLAVAKLAGVDFILNVTLDGARRVTGVFAGALEAAHQAAVAHLLTQAGIPVRRECDVVVTHAGFVGINHYQAAKAAVEAAKAVRAGGAMIIAADHTDLHPVGGEGYRSVLPALKKLGAAGFERAICAPGWRFVMEQWQVQMWARALRKLGSEERLFYASPQVTGARFEAESLPGVDAGEGLAAGGSRRDFAQAMVQCAIDRLAAADPKAHFAVLLDGPYGVPVVGG